MPELTKLLHRLARKADVAIDVQKSNYSKEYFMSVQSIYRKAAQRTRQRRELEAQARFRMVEAHRHRLQADIDLLSPFVEAATELKACGAGGVHCISGKRAGQIFMRYQPASMSADDKSVSSNPRPSRLAIWHDRPDSETGLDPSIVDLSRRTSGGLCGPRTLFAVTECSTKGETRQKKNVSAVPSFFIQVRRQISFVPYTTATRQSDGRQVFAEDGELHTGDAREAVDAMARWLGTVAPDREEDYLPILQRLESSVVTPRPSRNEHARRFPGATLLKKLFPG